jgi:hypothetical protein
MAPIPPPHGNPAPSSAGAGAERADRARRTLGGIAQAGLLAALLLAVSILVVVPAVFSLIPIPPEADGLTLCIPGVGPLQRFDESLHEDEEELVFIHERVHAEQCREWGALRFVRRLVDPESRLAMEAQAFCAETAVLALRGADREPLLHRTVDALATGYFPDGEVSRAEIVAAVGAACGGSRLAE